MLAPHAPPRGPPYSTVPTPRLINTSGSNSAVCARVSPPRPTVRVGTGTRPPAIGMYDRGSCRTMHSTLLAGLTSSPGGWAPPCRFPACPLSPQLPPTLPTTAHPDHAPRTVLNRDRPQAHCRVGNGAAPRRRQTCSPSTKPNSAASLRGQKHSRRWWIARQACLTPRRVPPPAACAHTDVTESAGGRVRRWSRFLGGAPPKPRLRARLAREAQTADAELRRCRKCAVGARRRVPRSSGRRGPEVESRRGVARQGGEAAQHDHDDGDVVPRRPLVQLQALPRQRGLDLCVGLASGRAADRGGDGLGGASAAVPAPPWSARGCSAGIPVHALSGGVSPLPPPSFMGDPPPPPQPPTHAPGSRQRPAARWRRRAARAARR